MTETLLKVTLHELCQLEQIEHSTIAALVEYGIAHPVEGDDITDWVFDTVSVHWIKKAVSFSTDLDLDWVAVAIVIDLLQQKEALERDNERYRRQLERFVESNND